MGFRDQPRAALAGSAEAVPLPISWTVCWQEDVDTGPSGSIAYVFTPTGAATRFGCILSPQVGFAIMHSSTRTRRCADCRSAEPKIQILAALPRVGFRLGSLSIWDINAVIRTYSHKGFAVKMHGGLWCRPLPGSTVPPVDYTNARHAAAN
jgi:hypothetical protein